MEALQNRTRGSREDASLCEYNQCHQLPIHSHHVSVSSSLCWQLKPWTETTPSCSSQKPLSHCWPAVGLQEEQVLLQETCSWLQELLSPPQQTAFLTRAQTLHLWIVVSNQAASSPLSQLYSTKDVVKQNLWSLYSNRASNSANTAARKEGEREDAVAGTAAA